MSQNEPRGYEQGTYPREWEEIRGGTHRLKVPGGWIVRTMSLWGRIGGVESGSEALTFFPDPAHTWELEPEGNHENA